MALLNERIDVAEILLSYDENFFSSVTDEVYDVYIHVLSDYQLSKFREFDNVSEILLFMLRHGADLWTEGVGFLAEVDFPEEDHDLIDLQRCCAIFEKEIGVSTDLAKAVLQNDVASIAAAEEDDVLTSGPWSLLHLAAFYNRLEAATLLLEKGADPQEVTERGGQTALMLASSRGHSEMTSLLLCAMRNGPQRHKK